MADLYDVTRADWARTLPQLGNDDGRIVTGEDVDRWLAAREARVAVVREAVLELGVDAVLAALEDLGVLREPTPWEELT